MIHSPYHACIVKVLSQSYRIFCTSLSGSSDTETVSYGGPRLITVMLYLSSVEVGGHTVFPQPGIAIKPTAGSLIFWFNQGAQNNYDSRTRHYGCPILYGNKWIANKWIKWFANVKHFPCLIYDMHYSIYKSHVKARNNRDQ